MKVARSSREITKPISVETMREIELFDLLQREKLVRTSGTHSFVQRRKMETTLSASDSSDDEQPIAHVKDKVSVAGASPSGSFQCTTPKVEPQLMAPPQAKLTSLVRFSHESSTPVVIWLHRITELYTHPLIVALRNNRCFYDTVQINKPAVDSLVSVSNTPSLGSSLNPLLFDLPDASSVSATEKPQYGPISAATTTTSFVESDETMNQVMWLYGGGSGESERCPSSVETHLSKFWFTNCRLTEALSTNSKGFYGFMTKALGAKFSLRISDSDRLYKLFSPSETGTLDYPSAFATFSLLLFEAFTERDEELFMRLFFGSATEHFGPSYCISMNDFSCLLRVLEFLLGEIRGVSGKDHQHAKLSRTSRKLLSLFNDDLSRFGLEVRGRPDVHLPEVRKRLATRTIGMYFNSTDLATLKNCLTQRAKREASRLKKLAHPI